MMAENRITNLITNGIAFLFDLIGIKDKEDEKKEGMSQPQIRQKLDRCP